MEYIGIKQLNATPMTRGGYNEFRGWTTPDNEDGEDKGYMVTYPDGYVSWSPKDVFEEAYRPMKNMSFSLALELVKSGKRVQREGWNGKGMFIFLVPGSTFTHGYIDMKTADGMIVPWLCSQTDALAEDWQVV